MDRNVKLFISGLHSDSGEEAANVETVYTAEYYKRNDSHYLFYEEQQEESDGNSRVRLKWKDNLLELSRQGAMQTLMVFEKDKKHMTRYVTPYGEIQLGIDTKDFRVEESEKNITVKIEYALEADGVHLSDCILKMRVEA